MGVVVILMAGTLTALASQSASAAAAVSRLAGADRFATSAAISAATFAPGVPVAYVANGYNFPDALSGAPAAGVKGGPVLLSAASGLSGDVQAELTRLRPAKIIVLGGPVAISDALETSLAQYTVSGTAAAVSRLAGADRFATSAAISAATFAPGVPVAYVANGYNFPDALSGAPAAGVKGGPVLLSAASGLSGDVQAELTRLRPAKIIVLGGPVAISDALETSLAQYTVALPLSITSSAETVPPGVAGAPFKMQLTGTGGSGSYAWSVTGLPAGLTIDPSQGLVNGIPASTGSAVATVTLTDTVTQASTSKPFTFHVPTAMPAQCTAQACSVVDPGVNTIQLTTTQLVSLTRDASGTIATVTTTGVTVAANDVLVLPVTANTPSGAVDIVQSVTTDATGNTVSTVTPGTPAQAFNSGTVQTDATAVTTTTSAAAQAKTYIGGKAVTDGTPVRTSAALSCDGQAQANADITLTTTLTPTLTAIWAHPLIQLGNVYLGSGGLQTAYVDLTGSISIGFNATISANGTCTLTLPEIHRAVPAGYLGAVVFDSTPSISLTANATIAASTSTTLTCSAGYYYYANAASSPPWHYCQKPVTDPLKLTTATATVSVAGHLPLTVSLDEAAGITGEFTPGLTATVTPAASTYATLDANVDASIGACLVCIWPDTPAKITLATGTIWGPKRLLTLTTAPGAPTPSPNGGLTGVTAIAAGQATGYALKNDGTVWAWGWGTEGRLGNGTNDLYSTVPVQVVGLTNVAAISAGASAAYAIKKDGTVWAWGYGLYGQLGNGSYTSSSVPVQVTGLSGITSVGAGALTAIARKSDGTVWSWGSSGAIPVQVEGLGSITQVSASNYTWYALKSDGTVWSWGDNEYGELGDGSPMIVTNPDGTNGFGYSNTPVLVKGLTDVRQIRGADASAYAVKADGTAWTWGYNKYGNLGNDTTVHANVPVAVTALTGVTALSGGGNTAYAMTSDDSVWVWGYNGDGEFGDGTTTGSRVPVSVPELAGATAIAAGERTGYALREDGAVWAWGDNYDGQFGDGTTIGSPIPIAVGG